MAQRVLAMLGAVAIVLVAIVARSAIDDRGSAGAGGGHSSDGQPVVACASDLVEQCNALKGVTIVAEPAAVTADRIASGRALDDGVDAWITTTAWSEVIESRAPGRLEKVTSLASSPVVAAIDERRIGAVTSLCGGGSVWRCLGDHADADWATLPDGDPRWGALKTGLPDADSAVGLSVLASVVSGFFGTTEFAMNDFEPSGLSAWLGQLASPAGHGEHDPVGTLVTTRGKYTAVADIRASVGTRPVEVLDAKPRVTATVVLIQLAGGDAVRGTDRLREALLATGWSAPSATPPKTTLKPGVMSALHTLWMEVTR